jgi:hypothetical protein
LLLRSNFSQGTWLIGFNEEAMGPATLPQIPDQASSCLLFIVIHCATPRAEREAPQKKVKGGGFGTFPRFLAHYEFFPARTSFWTAAPDGVHAPRIRALWVALSQHRWPAASQ